MNEELLIALMTDIDPVRDLSDSALDELVPYDHLMARVLVGIEQPATRAIHARISTWRRASLYWQRNMQSIHFRLSTIGIGLLAVAVSATALFIGLSSNIANAVTLYPKTNGPTSAAQLVADKSVMTARLHAVGAKNATVMVSHGALVVTNGPAGLATPTSFLTSSPELLVRSVTCYAKRQSGPDSTSPLPATCSSPQYDAPTVSGFAVPTTEPDPALAVYATTTPAEDAKAPNTWALLPLMNSGAGTAQRYLVGPTLVTLSSKVASATVARVPDSGAWLVNVRLNAAESQQWDRVAKKYFHRQLAVDLNGAIAEAPIIQPANTTFSSFDGQMQLVSVSKTDAYDLAAALTSGPLAVPLVARSSGSKAPESKAAAVSSPVCQASNITLQVGATYKGGGGYPSGTLLTPVTFTNRGPRCHLQMGGPTVRAVRGIYAGKATKVGQLSLPTVPTTNKVVTLSGGAREHTLVEVRGLPRATLQVKKCSSHSAEGFVVEDYAHSIATAHYFARKLANVCFYAGPGAITTDLGVVWVGINS